MAPGAVGELQAALEKEPPPSESPPGTLLPEATSKVPVKAALLLGSGLQCLGRATLSVSSFVDPLGIVPRALEFTARANVPPATL
jgi:hypothetical protein